MGWFPAELVEEVRLARAEDLASRPAGSLALDQRVAAIARRADVSDRLTRSGNRLGVTLTASVARMFAGLAMVFRVLVLVWVAERAGASSVAMGAVVFVVLAALRAVVANCVARRWNRWAAVAAGGCVAVMAGVGVWAWAAEGRPLMVGLFVLAELCAWLSLVVLTQARAQAGPGVVVA